MTSPEAKKGEASCPSCGSPAYAGHAPDCPLQIPVEELTERNQVQEYYIEQELANGETDDDKVMWTVKKGMEFYDLNKDHLKFFAIRDKGKR